MDNSNPSTKPTEINPLSSFSAGKQNTSTNDLLQLAVSMACLLYGNQLITYELLGRGEQEFDYTVRILYEFMLKKEVKCGKYPMTDGPW